MPACLPEQLWLQRGRLASTDPHSSSSSVGRRLREQAPHGGELLGGGEVRGGGDRDLLRRQVVARAHERQRLERLRRRAEERDEAGIARLLDHLAVAHHDRMHDVDRLDDAAPPDDHLDRVHRGSLCLDKRATISVWSGLVAHSPTPLDYDAADTLVVSEPAQLRALGDEVRGRIIALLRERAASASELAGLLEHAEGHRRTPPQGARACRSRARRAHPAGTRRDGEVLRPRRAALHLPSCDEHDDELVHGVGATLLRMAAAEARRSPGSRHARTAARPPATLPPPSGSTAGSTSSSTTRGRRDARRRSVGPRRRVLPVGAALMRRLLPGGLWRHPDFLQALVRGDDQPASARRSRSSRCRSSRSSCSTRAPSRSPCSA